MDKPATVTIICPYCGHENVISGGYVESQLGRPFVVTCDIEKRGCDQDFVARVKWVAEVEVKRVKGCKDREEDTDEIHGQQKQARKRDSTYYVGE